MPDELERTRVDYSLEPPPELRKNISVSYLRGGAQMYVHKPSLVKLAAELRSFVAAT